MDSGAFDAPLIWMLTQFHRHEDMVSVIEIRKEVERVVTDDVLDNDFWMPDRLDDGVFMVSYLWMTPIDVLSLRIA